VGTAIKAVATRWDHAAAPSYATVAAKKQALSPSRLHFHAATGEHGTEWGTVIHLLLQTALERPDADLRQLARLALTEEGLDADLADSALEMVNQVLRSDVLRRARSAEQYLVEVPFQKLVPAGGPGAVDGLPTIVRGVIDLAFHEQAGWVIVDYKTDRIGSSQVPVAVEHYRAQVDTYAHTWHEMLNQPVHERGLYFTHIDRYVRL
jgi:ATP-dependent helicase/nuclease subunit A